MKHMHVAALALAVSLYAAQWSAAAEPAPALGPGGMSLADMCKANPCRRNVLVRLKTAKETIETPVELFWPVVHDDVVHVLPGEKLYLEVEWGETSPTSIKAVESIADKSKTMTVVFQQDEKLGMSLQISNPFPFHIKYRAGIANGQGRFSTTSSCPVRAGIMGFELWPYVIYQLVLSDLRKLPDSDTMKCE